MLRLWVYFLMDEIGQQIAPLFHRPGPAPVCSDSELIAMVLIGECRGWDVETELLSQWREHRDLFPRQPSQSRFNRRRRQLMTAFNLIRRVLLHGLDVAQDRQCVIDSLPVPAVQFHLVLGSTGDWAAFLGPVSARELPEKQSVRTAVGEAGGRSSNLGPHGSELRLSMRTEVPKSRGAGT